MQLASKSDEIAKLEVRDIVDMRPRLTHLQARLRVLTEKDKAQSDLLKVVVCLSWYRT